MGIGPLLVTRRFLVLVRKLVALLLACNFTFSNKLLRSTLLHVALPPFGQLYLRPFRRVPRLPLVRSPFSTWILFSWLPFRVLFTWGSLFRIWRKLLLLLPKRRLMVCLVRRIRLLLVVLMVLRKQLSCLSRVWIWIPLLQKRRIGRKLRNFVRWKLLGKKVRLRKNYLITPR